MSLAWLFMCAREAGRFSFCNFAEAVANFLATSCCIGFGSIALRFFRLAIRLLRRRSAGSSVLFASFSPISSQGPAFRRHFYNDELGGTCPLRNTTDEELSLCALAFTLIGPGLCSIAFRLCTMRLKQVTVWS